MEGECKRIGFSFLASQTRNIIDEVKKPDNPELADRKRHTVETLIEQLQSGSAPLLRTPD
jgi:hypothetical protein